MRLSYFQNKAWQCPTLTWGDPTLPSAIHRFTSEFEMGSGGSNALMPPGKLVCMAARASTHVWFDQAALVLHNIAMTHIPPKYLGVIWSSLTGN
jgi:hypothetical protein